MKLKFDSDYMEGAHPKILQRLLETNLEQTAGYGTDEYCAAAAAKIREAADCPQAEVYFLTGGTQANATVVSSILRPYEGVIAADTGHINLHEAGAIESCGFKVLTVPNEQGKISANALEYLLTAYHHDVNKEHMVRPGMVYLSFPTEYGTLYSAAELRVLYRICRLYKIPLFIDGARLGYGLTADGNDVSLAFLAKNCDVFYIGGTKVGALFGEAVVVTKKKLIPHFFTMIKQHGALLAKGRILGLQFDTLFTDRLYWNISRHAVEMANRLRDIFQNKGYHFYVDAPTNQVFLILENEQMQRIAKKVSFSIWERYDGQHTVVRFATSWATTEQALDALNQVLEERKAAP